MGCIGDCVILHPENKIIKEYEKKNIDFLSNSLPDDFRKCVCRWQHHRYSFNKTTSEPLDFATVVLVKAETGAPLPIGTTTDENGVFIIPNAPSGKYIVRVSMIGNVTQEREITIGNSEINLGKIELAEDTKLLQEVVVTGQKSQLSVNAERRIFNVSSNINATGASADELLAAVPSVDVNSEGEISLRGNADVLVWINGKRWG